ncbi:MAG TPA: DUF177 domain-containing protein, partial [Fibrobacteraceae bacterium]|nr:DUF177 domain-containing protein [Fibrobacteraceae bacterium]
MDLEQLGSCLNEFDLVLDRSQNPNLFDELRLGKPLQAHFSVFEISDGTFRFEGSLQGTQLLTCVRTLESFERPFKTEALFEVIRENSLREQKLDDEDDELFRFHIPFRQNTVDITECVRQLVLLQEPMNPVKEPSLDFSWKDDS